MSLKKPSRALSLSHEQVRSRVSVDNTHTNTHIRAAADVVYVIKYSTVSDRVNISHTSYFVFARHIYTATIKCFIKDDKS